MAETEARETGGGEGTEVRGAPWRLGMAVGEGCHGRARISECVGLKSTLETRIGKQIFREVSSAFTAFERQAPGVRVREMSVQFLAILYRGGPGLCL